jgi:hypothetical protein
MARSAQPASLTPAILAEEGTLVRRRWMEIFRATGKPMRRSVAENAKLISRRR